MARGKAKSTLLGIQGIVGHRNAPDWGFLYKTSLTKDPNYNVGDRVVTPDGRVFRYAKAGNIITNQLQGVFFYGLLSDGVDYKAAQAAAIGDTEITIDAGDSGDYTEDQLRGGQVVIHTHGDMNHQVRGITGNTASDTDGNVTLYLDAPLTHTITVSHGVEVLPNPYNDVRKGEYGEFCSVAGQPNVATTVANQYLWIQTAGPCWCNPYGTVGSAGVANEREVVYDISGNVCPAADARGSADHASYQTAGFIIERQTTGIGASFIMLQISP